MVTTHKRRAMPGVLPMVAAFLLVFLALPNPLRVPNNNPTATAELAPVPGPPEESDVQGSFSETGLAESAGLGAGGLGAGGKEIPPLPPGQEIPVDKECVGNPPRQTEDPISPPCVPYWAGTNGGNDYQGVTKNEIRVVFYNDLNVEGDMSQPYEPSDETGSQADYNYVNLVKTVKYQLRYYQRRFQTYGRRVRLLAQAGSGVGASDEARRTDAVATQSVYKPFASVFLGNDAGPYFAKMADFKVPTFGLNEDVSGKIYERHAPYIWSFFPDQETQVKWSAGFMCRKLRPHVLKARFSPDPILASKPRKIGFIYSTRITRGPSWREIPPLLIKELKRQCGYEFDAVELYGGGAGAGSQEAPRIMARFKQENITTVVCYCVPVQSELTVSSMQSAATSASYFPEWYWDFMSRMDKPIWQQQYGNRAQASLGASYYWRQPAYREQFHYQSFVEETQDNSVPNVRWNFNIYYLFMNLFTAIQAAGPTLNPETVERGMFTFKYLKPSDPWIPTGQYGPAGDGTYTFVDTAMGWWWDPKGTPPGGRRGEGCQRVIQSGKRFYWNTWELGDADFQWGTTNDPCSEDRQRIRDPQPGDF